MVKTGARATALAQLFAEAGRPARESRLRAPRAGDVSADLAESLVGILESFGGSADDLTRLRPGAWDLQLADGTLVELDEELHFNRYRRLSLTGSWAEPLPWTSAYRSLCEIHEGDCLRAARWGKRWTNPSCERLFGPPGVPGDLSGSGAPRWKQRALYDAFKDAFALSQPGLRLARLSVYDVVDECTVNDLLRGAASIDARRLIALLDERTTGSVAA